MTQVEALSDLYTRLNSIPEFTAVYDSIAPTSSTSPYAVITSTYIRDGRLLNNTEKYLQVNINVWSSYKGKKEVIRLSDKIYDVLETDFDLENQQFILDPSGWSRAILTYSIYIEEE